MIRKQYILTLLAAAAFLCVCCGKAPQTTPETPPEVEPESFFCKGADISWVTEMEKNGYIESFVSEAADTGSASSPP